MKRVLLSLACIAVLGLSLVFGQLAQRPAGADMVEVAVLSETNWGQFVPEGKEVDAIYGDIVLRNSKVTAVIANPVATRNANMTTKDVAGCLIDFTVRDAQSDQLTAFYPTKKAYQYRSIEFLSPSSDGAPRSVAALPATGAKGTALTVTVIAAAADGKPEVRTSYTLAAGKDRLAVETSFKNITDQPVTVSYEDDFRADGGKEDMPRSPNGVADWFWLHDRYWGQAYGITADGDRKLQLNSDAKITQIKYVDAAGEEKVALPAGASASFTRQLFPGANLLEVQATRLRHAKTSIVDTKLLLKDGKDRPVANASVEIFRGDTLHGSGRTGDDGRLNAPLPAGDYAVTVNAVGSVVADRLPFTAAAGEKTLKLPGYQFGNLAAVITDSRGGVIPCKIELRPQSPGVKLDFGPETADFAVRNVRYTPNGQFTQALPPGKYDVIVSHGPEFDAVFTTVDVPAYGTADLKAQLHRTVDTKGWVSSDFHSHASPSGDNTSSQLGRVLNLVCEHIEFAPCTEHNRVTTYQPHIDRLKIGKFLSSVEGIELTGQPLPLNHQNAFPMKFTPRIQDGGAPTPAADLEQQIERLALWDDRSEKLVQVNHPDIGWMFYDKDGDGQPDSGNERAFPFMDVIEIHPVENVLDLAPFANINGTQKFHNTVFRWLQLLNQGFHIYGVVNTDAHYNFHGSGSLRNWIQSPTDEPSEIRHMDMVHASEQGRLVMSNGPFLEVWASEAANSKKVTSGQDLAATSKKIVLQVKAQCPNWIDLDRMFVLVNGRIHPQHNYFRDQHPDVFRSGAVKIDRTLELTLDRDSHVIVVVGDIGGNLSNVLGPDAKMPAAALTNPIFIDVDGNGFQANKDTLDAELPVKFGAK